MLHHKLCKYLSGVISERWFIGPPVKKQWAPWNSCNSCSILSQRLEWETQRIRNFSYKIARITFRRWLIWCVFLPWALWIGLMGITLLRLYYHNPALDTVDLCSCHKYIKPLYFWGSRVYMFESYFASLITAAICERWVYCTERHQSSSPWQYIFNRIEFFCKMKRHTFTTDTIYRYCQNIMVYYNRILIEYSNKI